MDLVAPAHDVLLVAVHDDVAVFQNAGQLDGFAGDIEVRWDRVPPHVVLVAKGGAVTVYAPIVFAFAEKELSPLHFLSQLHRCSFLHIKNLDRHTP